MKEYLEKYDGKHVLITGGAGCIGSNLTRTLLNTNVEKILVLDNLSSSEKWNIPNDPSFVRFLGVNAVNNQVTSI